MIALDKNLSLIWEKVKPLMAKVKKKDYALHVEMVTRAMSELLKKEGGDGSILIPAALLHDVGWSEVSENLQLATSREDKVTAGKQHIEIVLAHKYTKPESKDEQLLIDADTLSDTYKESFYS